MAGVADGRTTVGIDSIGNIAVSGKIPTTAAGGGSNVAVTNVSGNVRVVMPGVDVTASALNVNATFAAAEVAVTAGATPLPVNVVNVSGQVNVTATNNIGISAAGTLNVSAGGAYLSAIDTAASGTRAFASAIMANTSATRLDVDRIEALVTASALKVLATLSPASAQVVTAHAGGLAVRPTGGVNVVGSALNTNVVNISGNVRVTAGDLKLPVSGHMRGQVETSAPADVNELAYADVRITSARAMHVAQQGAVVAAICGVNVASSALAVNIATPGTNIGISAAALPSITIGNVSGQINVTASNNIGVSAAGTLNVSAGGAYLSAIDTATSGTRALVSAVMANTSATRLDIDRIEALVTASGLNVNATFGAAEVAVTAGATPLPVNVVNTSGQISVTAPTNIPVTIAAQPIAVSIAAKAAIDVSAQGAALQVTAQGGSFAVSAQGGSIAVSVQNEPLVDVCGVNRTGSAMNVFLAGTSAQVHVTGGDLSLPVNQTGVNVVNSAAAAYDVVRGDAIYNAAVSNPVKFGKLAQVAGAVCADIVAGVASRRIRVLGAYFNSTGTATAIFMTTGASAALSPKMVINTGFVLPVNPYGWLETAVGSALSLQVEGGSVGCIITYCEVF